MDFIVPKFIDREPKIMGPFTFKQFLYLLVPGVICFFLYFTLAKKNFPLFVFISIVLLGGGLAFDFLKIKGHPLPIFLKNLFYFSFSSKMFVWRRKFMPPKIQKIEKFEKKIEKEPVLKVAGRSRLQEISTSVETKKR